MIAGRRMKLPVSWEDVIDVFNKNVNNVLRLIMEVIPEIK